MATTTSQRLRLALAPPQPSPSRMLKSRPGKSNIAQTASQYWPDSRDASAQLSAGQTFGLSKRPIAKQATFIPNEETIPKSSQPQQQQQQQLQPQPLAQSGQVNSDKSSERPTPSNSHLEHLQHLQQASSALANRSGSSGKRPTWKSSTSALYSSPQQQQQAIERRRRGAATTASLTAATSLLQLNTTTTSASPNCQSSSSSVSFRQQQQQQQIANQRRASSLAAEISFLKSRSGGSTQHLEALREDASRASANSRRTTPQSSVVVVVEYSRAVSAQPQRRAKSVVAINTCAAKSTTRLSPTPAPAANSASARAALHQKGGTQIRRTKLQAQVTQPTAAVTNSRVRQGVLFARRQLHLTPVAPATATAAATTTSVPTRRTAVRPASQAQSQVKSSTPTISTKTTTTTCRRQLTRLTRAQPRPLAASKQASAAASQANKLATLAGPPPTTGHSTQQRAHLLFESASRRARAGHSQSAKKLSLDCSSSSSLDAPLAHIKRPRADPQPQPEAAVSPELSDKRRASLAATPITGEESYRRRWSSLESGSANEASSTPISCSSLSSSSSSSCLVIAASVRACGAPPVDRVHEARFGRQRRRHSSAESPAEATTTTTGNRSAAGKADAAASAAAAASAGRARQHVAAASVVDPQANTREQQEKVPNAYENDDERICDSHSTQQTTLGGDYSSTILISSSNSSNSDTDKLLFLQQQQQQPKPLGQALIIAGRLPSTCPPCQLTASNLDSNQLRSRAATSDVFHNNNDNTQCVCIVGRQPTIEDANCDANCADCASFHSKSLKHRQPHQPIGGAEDVSAPPQVAERAFSIKDVEQSKDDDENEPMVLSIDEQQSYLSSKLVSPLSQLQHQQHQQQQRRRQSQSGSPMSCDLGEQGGQDENTNLVAIPAAGANETTTTISAPEQPSKSIQASEQQIGATNERRVSCKQFEMPGPAQLKAINIEQIQNQEALAQQTADDAESSSDELGPASKKHQPESIVAIPTSPPQPVTQIKSNAKTDQISISQEPISDIYDLETRPFARGKFAQVKRCVRRDTRQCFAAKCIKKRRRLVDIKHEILLEIEALKLSYQTEYIVKLYEVYETPNEMVLILEMANGGELQRVLDDEEAIEEPLVRKMIKQILEGLVHLHDNQIAHLDIKPQNLLLTEPFPDGDVKLCDFGISRRITKDCEIRDICGTPDYVAPEILRYDPISLATDMWSLGVLTYVLLSGYSPFGSENKQQTFCNITQANLDFPIEIFGKITEDAVDFIRKLIVREPSGRLTSRQARGHHWINQ